MTIGDKQKKRTRKKKSLLKRLFSATITMCVFGATMIIAFFFYLNTQSLPAAQVKQTTQMLDAQGNVVDSFYAGQNREVVRLSDISPHLINAVIAIEDRRFHDHFGIDLYGTA